jgi:RNA recognition motif-containing protein
MGTKIYVGNLNYRTTDEGLRELFSQYGEVVSAQVISDRDTGRSRGFGFVEMGNDESAQAATSALNGQEFEGRALKVNEARPQSRGR